jgi:hypothetical protein
MEVRYSVNILRTELDVLSWSDGSYIILINGSHAMRFIHQ